MGEDHEFQTLPAGEDGEGAEGQQVGKGPLDLLKKNLKFVVAAVVGIIVLIIIIVVVIATTGGPALVDCSKDEFHSVSFNDSDKYLKFLAFGKSKFENLNFQEAVDMCLTKDAQLWEVQNKDEWLAIMDKLRDEQKDDIWLNGKMEEACPRVGAECMHKEAKVGKGIKMTWRSTNQVAGYSRLIGGGGKDGCVKVDPQDALWQTTDCKTSKLYAPCVKRNCINPGA